MGDLHPVCCMCGDIGFPDKLFRCTKCSYRFQHLYCSNYYEQTISTTAKICDWCISEERSTTAKYGISSKKSAGRETGLTNRSSECSSNHYKINTSNKQTDRDEIMVGADNKGKTNTTGAPSPKTTSRRYKFLKDVMC